MTPLSMLWLTACHLCCGNNFHLTSFLGIVPNGFNWVLDYVAGEPGVHHGPPGVFQLFHQSGDNKVRMPPAPLYFLPLLYIPHTPVLVAEWKSFLEIVSRTIYNCLRASKVKKSL